MKVINRQDPAFREKVSELERLNKSRTLIFSQVYKLLIETIKDGNYKLLACSYLDSVKPDLDDPQREFRFTFVCEPIDSENSD